MYNLLSNVSYSGFMLTASLSNNINEMLMTSNIMSIGKGRTLARYLNDSIQYMSRYNTQLSNSQNIVITIHKFSNSKASSFCFT